MKLLIDTNIILDVLLDRDVYCDKAARVLGLAERDDVVLYVSASAITDIYYIAQRQIRDKKAVKILLKKLLSIVLVAGVSYDEIRNALELEWDDFEDSVQYSVAFLSEMDGIVTRNTKDYAMSEIKVYSPEQLLSDFKKD